MANIQKFADMELPSDLKGMPPLQAFGAVWPLLKFVLAFAKIFTGSKADAKIDQILEWGDGVSAAGLFADNADSNGNQAGTQA